MPTNSHPGRRDFLKTAAAGAAGAMGVSALKFDKIFAQSTGGWVAGMQINPAIDNKRVICCHDTKMLTATPANQTWAGQNANVDEKQVGSNLDQMAMLLTNKTSAADAWSTIFRSSKPWGSTKVAMKTNGIGSNTTNRPRVAIYKKITDVLVDQLGVQPSNIVLYDNCDNATTYYSPSMSLTDSTKIRAVMSSRAQGLGGFKAVTLTNAQGISCAADLVDGNIDILVNVAACKSHNGTGNHYNYGSCTLCMRTIWAPSPTAREHNTRTICTLVIAARRLRRLRWRSLRSTSIPPSSAAILFASRFASWMRCYPTATAVLAGAGTTRRIVSSWAPLPPSWTILRQTRSFSTQPS